MSLEGNLLLIAVILRFKMSAESDVRLVNCIRCVNHHFEAVADAAYNGIEILVDLLLKLKERKIS